MKSNDPTITGWVKFPTPSFLWHGKKGTWDRIYHYMVNGKARCGKVRKIIEVIDPPIPWDNGQDYNLNSEDGTTSYCASCAYCMYKIGIQRRPPYKPHSGGNKAMWAILKRVWSRLKLGHVVLVCPKGHVGTMVGGCPECWQKETEDVS